MAASKSRSKDDVHSNIVDALTPYLSQYSLGGRIHDLRLSKSMGLVELGRQAGLSAAMLSKLENNHVIPTLQTLSKIALVFSVGLDHFFPDLSKQNSVAVTHADNRMEFEEKLESQEVLYSFECLDYPAGDRKFRSYLATFRSGAIEKLPQHAHDGAEFIYVLSGTLGLRAAGEEFQLQCSDTAQFNARLPHGYRRIGDAECKAIIVTSP